MTASKRYQFEWNFAANGRSITNTYDRGKVRKVKLTLTTGLKDYYCTNCGMVIPRGQRHLVGEVYRLHDRNSCALPVPE